MNNLSVVSLPGNFLFSSNFPHLGKVDQTFIRPRTVTKKSRHRSPVPRHISLRTAPSGPPPPPPTPRPARPSRATGSPAQPLSPLTKAHTLAAQSPAPTPLNPPNRRSPPNRPFGRLRPGGSITPNSLLSHDRNAPRAPFICPSPASQPVIILPPAGSVLTVAPTH